VDQTWAEVISELFVNLSAGWFGAALIIPIRGRRIGKIKLGLLTINVVFGILFLVFAYTLRKYG